MSDLRVRVAIEAFDPLEEVDEDALLRTRAYLEANGYQQDDIMPAVDGTCVAYFVYDVIKWTFANDEGRLPRKAK